MYSSDLTDAQWELIKPLFAGMRNPSLTEKGKPSTFMTESHGKTVSVKWVK